MKVLLLSHGSFLEDEPQAREWILSLSKSLRDEGCEVWLFKPDRDKIKEFDIVHAFFLESYEAYSAIKSINRHLCVTPALFQLKPPVLSLLNLFKRMILRWAKGLFHMRWPPNDELLWLKSPERFFVLNEDWVKWLHYQMHVPLEKINRLSKDPVIAGKELAVLYSQIFSQI